MNTTDPQEIIREQLEQLLAAMVTHPSELNVRLVPSQRKPTLVITCNLLDFGVILGTKHKMLDAMKVLAATIGSRYGITVNLLLDEAGCTPKTGTRLRTEPNPNWDAEPFEKLATLFCNELLGPCQVAVEPVTITNTKVTVTMTSKDSPHSPDAVEQALETALGCIGITKGQQIQVELVTPTFNTPHELPPTKTP